MDRGTGRSPRFNPDLPPTPAYVVDTEDEQTHNHGSCPTCRDGIDERSANDPRQSLCPCCQRRRDPSTPTRNGSDRPNGHALKLNVDPDSGRNYDCERLGSKYGQDDEAFHLQEAQPRLGRKWEHFQGKNNFYCDGRIMTAPTIRYCMLSFGLILVTFGLFIVFEFFLIAILKNFSSGPFLAERVTLAIPIIGSVLFLLVVVNMAKTSCSDPGILPRASQQEHEFIERTYGGNSITIRPPPRTKDIIVNGQTVKSKYCFTCKMFRPPRASHCGVCDNCVDRFDHHCPFLSNCIGKRNYRSFYIFIISLSLLAVFILCCSITHLAILSNEKNNFLEALKDTPTSAVVVLISFFGMWTVIGLAGFHTYLIAMEQTTNEDIKGLFGRGNTKNPYSRGNFCLNCCFILCGPHHPSLLNPRGKATTDFLASLPRKNPSGGTASGNPTPISYPPSSAVRAHCGELSSNAERSGYPLQTPLSLDGVPVQSTSFSVSTAGIAPTSPHPNGQIQTTAADNVGLKSGTLPEIKIASGLSTGDGNKIYGSNTLEANPTIIHQPSQGAGSVKSQSYSYAGENCFVESSTPDASLSMVQLDFPSNNQNSNNLQPRSRSPIQPGVSMLEDLTMINSPLHLDLDVVDTNI